MGTLVTNAQVWCDRVSDSSISTSQWKAFAAMIYRKLHQEIVDSGCRYFESEATINATGAATYAEPTDLNRLLGVDLVLDSAGSRRTLKPATIADRERLAGQTGEAEYFAQVGTNIVLYPNPTSGTYKVLYVPQPTDHSATADATGVDVVCPAGEGFMVWGMVSIAQHKGELNQQRALAEYAQAREDVRYWASLRNQAATWRPARIDDDLGDDGDPDFRSNPP